MVAACNTVKTHVSFVGGITKENMKSKFRSEFIGTGNQTIRKTSTTENIIVWMKNGYSPSPMPMDRRKN